MPLVRVRQAGQITLPAAVRKQLELEEGAYLEAEVRDGLLVLKPMGLIDREGAWRDIREIQERVRYVGPEPRPSPEEEEQQVYEIVREHRERDD